MRLPKKLARDVGVGRLPNELRLEIAPGEKWVWLGFMVSFNWVEYHQRPLMASIL